MTTAAITNTTATPADDEPVTRVAFDLPKSCLDWLEREALRRKQEQGGRMAKSPIVVELIERAMRGEDEGDR